MAETSCTVLGLCPRRFRTIKHNLYHSRIIVWLSISEIIFKSGLVVPVVTPYKQTNIQTLPLYNINMVVEWKNAVKF